MTQNRRRKVPSRSFKGLPRKGEATGCGAVGPAVFKSLIYRDLSHATAATVEDLRRQLEIWREAEKPI